MVSPHDHGLEHQRALFPALLGKRYFNFGTQGPLPRAALDALLGSFIEAQAKGPVSPQAFPDLLAQEERMRSRFGDLLGVDPSTMALVDSTCTGCAIVIHGIDWKPGDHVVLSDAEYPAVQQLVRRLHDRYGVTHTVVPLAGHAAEAAARWQAALTDKTRLGIVSHVLWTTGEVMPIEAMAKACNERGGALLVDGAQSVGMIPVHLRHSAVGFYAFAGHKHLCGPDGIGGLYVATSHIETLEPVFSGWRGVVPDANLQPRGFQKGARRFEQSTTTFATRPAMMASLDVHAGFEDEERRSSRAIERARRLHSGLAGIAGVRMVLPAQPASALVAFHVDGASPEESVKALHGRGVYLRSLGPAGALRAATHYLTSDDDVEGLLGAVRATARAR